MKTRIFQVAGLLALALLFLTVPLLAQDPTIEPGSGSGDLTEYFNFILAGITAAATTIVGYIAKYIPGINMIGDQFLRILAAVLTVALALFIFIPAGRNWFDIISVLFGFLTSTGLIYPGVLKPAGLKSPK